MSNRDRRQTDSESDAQAAAQANDENTPSSVSDGPSVEKIVSEELEKLAAEKADLKNTLIRLQADFDNYRKRIDRERHQERHRGAEIIAESLLPVLDGFDRAISSHRDAAHNEYREGFQLIRKQLLDALAKHGLQKIETRGAHFDPHVHHAIERVETTEQPDGSVLEELQAGYTFQGKVLRPAMVRVAANPEGHEAASNSASNSREN